MIDVLLVDDQPMVAEVLRRMLQDEADIRLHYCEDPFEAIPEANAVAPAVILQDLEVVAEFSGMRNFCAGAREGEWVSSAKAENMRRFDKTHGDTPYGYSLYGAYFAISDAPASGTVSVAA
jgi:DNA-binding NarL/FixJ family response regulator